MRPRDNDRAENSHLPVRKHVLTMQRFKSQRPPCGSFPLTPRSKTLQYPASPRFQTDTTNLPGGRVQSFWMSIGIRAQLRAGEVNLTFPRPLAAAFTRKQARYRSTITSAEGLA